MADGIAKSAINILEKNYFPEVKSAPGVFSPTEQHKQIFTMLDVFDRDAVDEDINTKVKFIYESLGENPRDKLLSLFTELGALPMGENRVDRTYRYLRLKSKADKYLNNYELIQRELHGFRTR